MEKNRMYRIACVGENCVDSYARTGEIFFGGNPVNAAVYAIRLGLAASYLGAVGTDRFGLEMLTALSEKGIDVSHAQILEGNTALTHVSIENGERVFGKYDEGVMKKFMMREEDSTFLAGQDLAARGLWGHCENSLGRIRSLGIPVVFDSSDRTEAPESVLARKSTDIFFFSDDKSGDQKLRNKLQRLSSEGPGLVIATRGDKGSLAWDGERFVAQGIIPVQIADTMGAGDSFIAGFAAAWLEGRPLPECMLSGAKSSAVTLQYPGAW